MLSAKEIKTGRSAFSSENKYVNSDSELKFITELGRRLLVRIHPKKVAEQVAVAIQSAVKMPVCALVVELENIGLVSFAVGFENQTIVDFLHRQKFKKRLEFLPPQISDSTDDTEKFLLKEKAHTFEYVSPLQVNGKVKGAIIAGFNKKHDCGEKVKQLIDAAAQMAAMSLNLSAHYEETLKTSINSAKEEHRKFTEAIVDALPVSLYVIDRDFRIVTWNRHREVGVQGIARDSVIGRNVFEVLINQPENILRKEFERAFQTGKIERIEQRTTDATGATKHWIVSKIPMRDETRDEITHVITVGEDVTARVGAIHAVGRAEKLAAIGRLAAGVVHEINNPLATISVCAEVLETRVAEGVFDESAETEDWREYLGLIRSEVFRCKNITTGLLDFSRVQPRNCISLDVGLVVQSAARLLAHQKQAGRIEIKLEIGEHLPPVNADEAQLQQAIISLAANAFDAMPNGGVLTLKVAAENGRVVVEVRDTGEGISPENISKIFEPFFTTKEIGKGTGLGLAVCYGIVTEHGGKLSVRSNIGIGSTFTIFLPAHLASPESKTEKSPTLNI